MSPPYPRHAWHNGEIVPWEACVLHARMQGAFWGANVFEGIRGYWSPASYADGLGGPHGPHGPHGPDERLDRRMQATPELETKGSRIAAGRPGRADPISPEVPDPGEPPGELYLFRLEDHLERMERSMKCMRMTVPWSLDELRAACLELCRVNDFREDVHVVVVAYFGMGPGCDTMNLTADTGVHVTAVPKPRSPSYEKGVSVGVSSWRRICDDTMPPRVKAGANYQNNRLAHQEAVRNGYDTALILNQWGTLAEAPGSCAAMVRDGRLVTPPSTSGALEGITLDTVVELAHHELGLDVVERPIDRTELYVADELFLCGTLAEILPVVSVDGLPVGAGAPGHLTRDLQFLYEQAVHAESAQDHWTTPVHTAAVEDPLAAMTG